MIITFIGHRSLYHCNDLFEKIQKTIITFAIPEEKTTFYCGGYGDFDNLCARVCPSVKDVYPNIEIVYVTPYITETRQAKMKALMNENLYDSTIYPPLENVPLRFAISKRNEWMVKEADVIIAYVTTAYGGAYKSLAYARKKKKHIINLAE